MADKTRWLPFLVNQATVPGLWTEIYSLRAALNKLIEDFNSAGTVDTFKLKVTSSDTTAGFLTDSLVAGTGINLTVLNPAADEQYEVSIDASVVPRKNVVETITASWTWTANVYIGNSLTLNEGNNGFYIKELFGFPTAKHLFYHLYSSSGILTLRTDSNSYQLFQIGTLSYPIDLYATGKLTLDGYLEHKGARLGFFGASSVSKTAVADQSTWADIASGTDSVDLADLNSKVKAIRDKLQEVIDALQSYGLL